MNEHQIWLEVIQHRLYFLQHGRCQSMQSLTGLHDIKIVFGSYFEEFQHLIKHFPVLGSHTYPHIQCGTV